MDALHRWGMVTAIVAVVALAAAPSARGEALTWQADAQHSGFVEGGGPTPPLRRRWTARLGHQVSYPVVGDGKVFVVTTSHDARPRLVALHARSGRVAWTKVIGENYGNEALAFDAGRVFVGRQNRFFNEPRSSLLAFAAADGRLLWEAGPGAVPGALVPVAFDGTVYVHYDGPSAWRAEDGALLWHSSDGFESSYGAPAVLPDLVLVNRFCGSRLVRFRRSDGAALDPVRGDDCDESGVTTTVANGRAYIGPDMVFDVARNERVATRESHLHFTVSPTVELAVDTDLEREWPLRFGHTIIARRPGEDRVRWTFRGDGYLDSMPLIAGNTVYVGSGSGRVYGINARTGRLRWRGDAGAPVWSPHHTSLLSALAASDGLLLVPAMGRLVAFG